MKITIPKPLYTRAVKLAAFDGRRIPQILIDLLDEWTTKYEGILNTLEEACKSRTDHENN